MRELSYKIFPNNEMRELSYKIFPNNDVSITICPYNVSDSDTLLNVGGFYCRRICHFNVIPLISSKSKKILCTADEEFGPSKNYKLLLTEKKMQ